MMKSMMGFVDWYVDGSAPWRIPPWPGARGGLVMTAADWDIVVGGEQ